MSASASAAAAFANAAALTEPEDSTIQLAEVYHASDGSAPIPWQQHSRELGEKPSPYVTSHTSC